MRTFLSCECNSECKKSHVCDDCIDMKLGMFTLSGVCAAYLLVRGAVADKKILVHPESKISVPSAVAV
jgi:hypothetical protein